MVTHPIFFMIMKYLDWWKNIVVTALYFMKTHSIYKSLFLVSILFHFLIFRAIRAQRTHLEGEWSGLWLVRAPLVIIFEPAKGIKNVYLNFLT